MVMIIKLTLLVLLDPIYIKWLLSTDWSLLDLSTCYSKDFALNIKWILIIFYYIRRIFGNLSFFSSWCLFKNCRIEQSLFILILLLVSKTCIFIVHDWSYYHFFNWAWLCMRDSLCMRQIAALHFNATYKDAVLYGWGALWRFSLRWQHCFIYKQK